MTSDKHSNYELRAAEIRTRQRAAIKDYTSAAIGRMKYTLLLLAAIIGLQMWLLPDDFGSYILIIGVVVAIDLYSTMRGYRTLNGWRTVRLCLQTIGFVLLMTYLWAIFGWLGLAASIAGYLLISTTIAGIMVFNNREEWNKASDMVAGMIQEWRR